MEPKLMISFGRNLACGLDMAQGLYDKYVVLILGPTHQTIHHLSFYYFLFK